MAGTDTVDEDTWVTMVPEVRDSCSGYGPALRLRLNQLLGLPPQGGDTLMVEMTVPLDSVCAPWPTPRRRRSIHAATPSRRSAANASQPPCSRGTYGWMADNLLTRWQVPNGYPWTRLGYTYNWHPGSPRYGASEYLVRKGTVASGVTVNHVRAYCRGG